MHQGADQFPVGPGRDNLTLTEALTQLAPELIVLLFAVAIITVDLVGGRQRTRRIVPALALVGLLASLVVVFLLHGSDEPVATMLVVDNFALFFKVIVYLGAMLAVLASIGYIEKRSRTPGEFYALLLAAALAMGVAVSANNLVLIYLGIEFLSITSYLLAGFLRDDIRSNEAAMKYFLYGSITSAVMLYGFSLLYGATGSTDLGGIADAFGSTDLAALRGITFPAIVLMLAGLGFKTSLVPFHQWTPDAYEGAPTPVAALLSTASKATGFAVLARILLVALPLEAIQNDWVAILAGISMVTMTLGNLVAIRQTNIKRLLAYSTIAQAGYMLIGLVSVFVDSGNPFTGVSGVMLYLFGYLFTNIGAWLAVIAVEERTGSTEIADYAGMVRRSPWLALSLLIFFLSLAGIPPTSVFIGKLFVFGAAVQMQLFVLAAVGVINSIVSIWYYLNVVRLMFMTEAKDESPIRIGPAVQLGLVVTLVLTLVMGIYPQPFIEWAGRSMQLLAMH